MYPIKIINSEKVTKVIAPVLLVWIVFLCLLAPWSHLYPLAADLRIQKLKVISPLSKTNYFCHVHVWFYLPPPSIKQTHSIHTNCLVYTRSNYGPNYINMVCASTVQ